MSTGDEVTLQQLDRERLTKITDSLIQTITSPEFIERMRSFRSVAERTSSFEEAGSLMSIESLREAGAELPEDFRITSRVFEDYEKGTRIAVSPIEGFDPRVAWGACAGGGAATVCGCAGGSTLA
jgi:hypothetical protein